MGEAHAILVAGGSGSRFRSATPKQFQTVLGKPLVVHALERLRLSGSIAQAILVLPRDGFDEAKRAIAPYLGAASGVEWAPGGNSRQESMIEGLSRIEPFDGLVLVHDAARPAVPPSLVAKVVEAAAIDGGAIAALPVVETIKEASSDLKVTRTVPREYLYRAQTPQCFRYEVLARAVSKAIEDRFSGTDEASLVERLGAPIRIVLGSEQNLKVTTLEDLERVEYYLKTGGRT
ncbi:MAG: 2-C-methyl-D-erythritol 4-phosphate cytidylyltransferase, partial [Vicinamibacteria bacterium]